MCEKDIYIIIKKYREFVIELVILRDCTIQHSNRHEELAKLIALVEHWMDIVSPKEKTVLSFHLIVGLPWSEIAMVNNDYRASSDIRALQRIQKRAIQKILYFTTQKFGTSLEEFIKRNI